MTTAPADTFRRSGQEAPLRPAPALPGRLRDLLAGKKVVITGVTGFIGEQLLWKMLTELPETRPSVLVRRKGSASAVDRVSGLLRKPIFADAVAAAGGIAALLEQRVEVIEGDLPNVPELPADLDVLVHCAGDVSFDPPIDQAFSTNVVGTQVLLERMLAAVRGEDGTPTKVPHYVHISTAYTAGRRRGAIPEGPHEHSRRLPGGDRGRPADARPGRGGVADAGAAGGAAQAVRARAPAGRLPGHRGRHRAPPAGVGRGRAGPGRGRAGPVAGLDRRLHLHQGPGRGGGGRGGRRHPGLHRPAGDRGVVLEAPVPGLDRGLQDGRAADPGVRPR